jgi:sulfite reductase (NADPH) flavoprotein alpha-component
MTIPAPLPANDSAGEPDVFVLYGTESGNAKIIAFDAIRTLERAAINARVLGLNELAPSELTKIRHAIFIVSTSGDGDMPYNAVDFWDALVADDFPRLERMRYGVIALGESVYEDFCAAGIAMDERLHALGATRLVDRVDCDYDFEVHAAAWLEGALDIYSSSIATEEPQSGGTVVVSEPADEGRPKFDGRIAEKRTLTRNDADREVVHYTIDVDIDRSGAAPFDWQPGDSLNLYYGNDPAIVGAIIERLALRADDIPVGFDKSLAQLLAVDVEIRAISRDLVQAVAAQAAGNELNSFLATSTHAEFEKWRETNDLLQLLLDHPQTRFTAAELLAMLRPLQPRAYSIASSPRVQAASIDISVRTVAYRHGDRDHSGVVSGGLSQRSQTGEPIAVQHVATPSFRLPDDLAADVVMVGAGVGIAPFRAFLQHRAKRGDTGRNWLFHGIRHPDEDEIYAADFARWRDVGLLQSYDLCASRVPEGRRYVQDGMRARGRELFEYLADGGFLYVCGDAHHMAKGVRSALRDIAADALGSPADGEFFVEGLQAARRYRQDVY